MDDIIIKEGVHFIGNPCEYGHVVRYVKGGTCVLCSARRRKQRRQNIKEANKDKNLYYEGNPCINCGSCVRSVSSGDCVLCRKNCKNKLSKKRKEENGIHFEGEPCSKCGSCNRYSSTGTCVLCASEWGKQRRQNMQETNNNGEKHFDGIPCVKCDSTIRYTNNGACVLCSKVHKKKIRHRRKEENKGIVTFEGNPCKHGHTTRYAISGDCVLCSANRTRQRNDKRKQEHENKGIFFKGDPCKCGNSLRYISNNECVLCKKEKEKQYVKRNLGKIITNVENRRARKNDAEGSFTNREWLELCNQYGNKCIVPGCENTNLERDHIVPLSKGGTNYIDNIQPLCKSCNCSKGTKIIDYRSNSISQ